MKTCLIELQKGSKVESIDDGKVGEILDFKLVPNGINSPEIVCLLYVKFDDGRMRQATSKNFKPCEDKTYKEFYPTAHFSNLK